MCPFLSLVSTSRFLWPAIDSHFVYKQWLFSRPRVLYLLKYYVSYLNLSFFLSVSGWRFIWNISSDERGLELTKKLFFFLGGALKIKFQRFFFEYREFKQECEETVLEMNAHLLFFFQENVEEGECSCIDCKTPFHKRFISSDRGRLLSGTLINASFSPLL